LQFFFKHIVKHHEMVLLWQYLLSVTCATAASHFVSVGNVALVAGDSAGVVTAFSTHSDLWKIRLSDVTRVKVSTLLTSHAVS